MKTTLENVCLTISYIGLGIGVFGFVLFLFHCIKSEFFTESISSLRFTPIPPPPPPPRNVKKTDRFIIIDREAGVAKIVTVNDDDSTEIEFLNLEYSDPTNTENPNPHVISLTWKNGKVEIVEQNTSI